MQEVDIQALTQKPLFDPTYLNIEYVFKKILEYSQSTINALSDPNTWIIIGVITALISILLIAIIVFSVVRMKEIQAHEKEKMQYEIDQALLRTQEMTRKENPRWHYVLTLTESPNNSDWRVAIIEADSFLEESLKDKNIVGDTVAELLENAKTNGYRTIQNAWDAHLVRNQIAHAGSDFPLSQVEARRTIRMFQNFLEELGVLEV